MFLPIIIFLPIAPTAMKGQTVKKRAKWGLYETILPE
jgi:hypothetical protein